MNRYDLSIIIPARNEMFLARTVEDILAHIEGKTEIIVILDGAWADPGIPQNEHVTVVYHNQSIGQRAACNEAVKLSNSKYIMKVDAHCSFDQGFDVKMISEMQDDWTMVPIMKNLHAFDWVCKNGHRRYQGPSGPCTDCGEPTERDILWIAKSSPNSTSYCFDKTLHFQYFGEYKKKQEGDIVETMGLQGSCFMLTREKYWELDICDEAHGSWGQQGVEVACKTWLSGGRVVCNKKTWYAHMFRTQGGDFGFPYPNPGIEKARQYSKELWLNDKWDKAKYPLSWLVEKFNPPHWNVSKGIVYITDNRRSESILKPCQEQLKSASKGIKIVSVSLKKTDFGENITLPLERGHLTLFKQILCGLEALDTDVVFLCDDDVLYHPSHFDFVPPEKDVFYYNLSWWRWRTKDGFAVHWDAKQSNFLCANREFLIQEYKERVRRVEAEGWLNGGYEPGTRSLRRGGFSDSKSDIWWSEFPSIDIRHGKNMTADKWKKEDFRDRKRDKGWRESTIDKVPGWQNINDVIKF